MALVWLWYAELMSVLVPVEWFVVWRRWSQESVLFASGVSYMVDPRYAWKIEVCWGSKSSLYRELKDRYVSLRNQVQIIVALLVRSDELETWRRHV